MNSSSFMKYYIIILVNALFCVQVLNAQQYNPEKVNKKAINIYNMGLNQAQGGNYEEAIAYMSKALELDNGYVDAWLTKAGIYGEMKQYEKCIIAYEQAFALDSDYSKDYKLPYAINLAGAGRFQKALDAVNDFLANPKLNEQSKKAGEYRKRCFEFAVQ